MNTKIELTLATEGDCSRLLSMVKEFHQFEGLEIAQALRENAIRKLITSPNLGGIWLIEYNNETIGYIALCKGFSIEFGGYDAFIDEFFIESSYRGQGIGKITLESLKHEAKKLDIKAIHLEVNKNNVRAQKLYAGAKFELRDKYIIMSVDL